MSSGGTKRKRTKLNEDDELASDVAHTPLSNAKRKKVNSTGPSPAIKTFFGSNKKKSAEQLNVVKQGKENGSDKEGEDELADEQAATPNRKKSKKDVFEVPSSPEEERSTRRSGSIRSKPTSSVKKTYSAKGMGSASKQHRILDEPAADVYDVPDSESSPERGRKSTASTVKPKAVAPSAKHSSPNTPKQGAVRQRKSDILKHAKQLSNKATREKMMAEQKSEAAETKTAMAGSSGVRRSKRADALPGSESQFKTTSAVKNTGKTVRDRFNAAEQELNLKSALTPSKSKIGRPQKSVAFQDMDEVDLGFKDLSESASAKKAAKRNTIQPSAIVPNSDDSSTAEPLEEVSKDVSDEEHSSDEDDVACDICSETHSDDANPIILCDECGNGVHMKCSKLKKVPKGTWLCSNCVPPNPDDIACGVCGNPKHTKKNPIILCETCDNGIHLDCSSLSEVPEGEWFCEVCNPATENTLPKDVGANPNISSKFPDIENFETHLRCMQRVVLDKLTGQRRVKLIGHDDEMQKVYQVFEQTIVAGEGNSMLIIGARGCGKTTVRLLVTDHITFANYS